MNNRTAVFCFSASSIIGSGHSIRCNTFADILDETGWSIRFIVGEETIMVKAIFAPLLSVIHIVQRESIASG